MKKQLDEALQEVCSIELGRYLFVTPSIQATRPRIYCQRVTYKCIKVQSLRVPSLYKNMTKHILFFYLINAVLFFNVFSKRK